MKDMISLYHKGGRIVVHHLEFDCGIIQLELERSGLEDMQHAWDDIARSGVCTMDPALGKWVRSCLGTELAPHPNGNAMRLNDMLAGLIPDQSDLLGKHHTAGADAQLHLRLYRKLQQMVNVHSLL